MLKIFGMLYVWGVSASLLVGVPKSILEWNYIRRKNRKFFKDYKKAKFLDKLLLQLKGMVKCFIPFYNIIHPFRSLSENSKYRMLKHEEKFYKEKPGFGKKMSDRVKRLGQNIVEFFAPVKDEEEELAPEKKPEVEKPVSKPIEKPVSKPERKPETLSTTTKELDRRIELYREEYGRLREEYDELKSKGASVAEINAKVAQMKIVVDRYNSLKAKKKTPVIDASKCQVETEEKGYTRVLK